jgi:hypothetical protein
MPIGNILDGELGSSVRGKLNATKDLAESLANRTYWFVTGNNGTAQSHVGGATTTFLNNNGLSSDTASYNPDSKSVIWDTSTNSYDFTSLKIGDTIHITGRILFNNVAAQEVDMIISAAEGTTSVHEHTLNHTYYKTAKVGTSLTFNSAFVIRNEDERTGPARIRFESLDAASITVVSWTTIVTSV